MAEKKSVSQCIVKTDFFILNFGFCGKTLIVKNNISRDRMGTESRQQRAESQRKEGKKKGHLVKNKRLALKRGLMTIQEFEPGVAQGPAQENAENDESHQLREKKM